MPTPLIRRRPPPTRFANGDRVAWTAFADVEAGEGMVLYAIPPEPGGLPCYGVVVWHDSVPVPDDQPLIPERVMRAIDTWSRPAR